MPNGRNSEGHTRCEKRTAPSSSQLPGRCWPAPPVHGFGGSDDHAIRMSTALIRMSQLSLPLVINPCVCVCVCVYVSLCPSHLSLSLSLSPPPLSLYKSPASKNSEKKETFDLYFTSSLLNISYLYLYKQQYLHICLLYAHTLTNLYLS